MGTFTQEVTKGTHSFELRMRALLILGLLALTLGHVHGQGYLQKGDRCKNDDQCISGTKCCGIPGFKRCWECCNFADCPTGKRCREKQCVGGGGSGEIGSRCRRDSTCQSGNCCGWPFWSKRCWECCSSRECPSGKECRSKQCVTKGNGVLDGVSSRGQSCAFRPCDTGLSCCSAITMKKCRFPLCLSGQCWGCCTDAECPAGQKCKGHACHTPAPTTTPATTVSTPTPLTACSQLTELLSISGSEGLCDPPGPAPTPTSKPVSCSLGGRDPNSTLLYPILFPVGVTAGETVPIVPGTIDGVQIISTVRNQVSDGATAVINIAPSILDFNIFRSNVLQAIDILDQKIRDILAVMPPTTCP